MQLALCSNDVESMKSLINKAYKLSDTQEMSKNRTSRIQQNDQRRMDNDHGGRSSQRNRSGHRLESSRQPLHKKFESYTPLAVGRAQILNTIANESYLRRPNPITHGPNMDKTRYCSFHKDYDHTIEDCHKLKDEIGYHIKRGVLKEYVRQGQPERHQDAAASGSKLLSKKPIIRVIHMITGATEECAQFKSKRKQHLRSIMAVEGSSKRTREDENWQIKFSPNTNIVQDNGNDPIIVSAIINTFLVEKILIYESIYGQHMGGRSLLQGTKAWILLANNEERFCRFRSKM